MPPRPINGQPNPPLRADDEEILDRGYHPPEVKLHITDLSHPGAARFLSTLFIAKFMKKALPLVWKIFYGDPRLRVNRGKAPRVDHLTLVLSEFDEEGCSVLAEPACHAWEIHISLDGVRSAPPSSVLVYEQLVGVLLRQIAQCFQHRAKGTAPKSLVDGISDWVRLKCGYPGRQWSENPSGRWDSGDHQTAYFLEYLEIKFGQGTIRCINAKMKQHEYVEGWFWEKLFGKPVGELYAEYQEWFRRGERPAQLDEVQRMARSALVQNIHAVNPVDQ